MIDFWDIILVVVGVIAFFLSINLFGHVDYFSIVGIVFIFAGLYRIITK